MNLLCLYRFFPSVVYECKTCMQNLQAIMSMSHESILNPEHLTIENLLITHQQGRLQ